MTDEALAALAEAATAGPWEASIGVTAYGYKVSGHYDPRTLGSIGTKEIVLVDVRHWSAPAFGPLLKEAEANAAFIAAARDAVPSLLARVKELEGALRECAADYRSPPCTVAQGAEYLAAEFMRRMEIASAAIRKLEDGDA